MRLPCMLLLCWALLPTVSLAQAPAPGRAAPESLEDLRKLEKQVEKVLEKVLPCTVGVRFSNTSGSGVIISKDGYVLTAGHVSGAPNRDVTIILQDGKKVKAKTLGSNNGIDSGMIKIVEPGDWKFLEMGKSADLQAGQWVIAAGHPGGYKTGRTPVVRVGRLLRVTNTALVSDCTIVGGDSGGPLFDLEGKVVGIHSRITSSIQGNVHVPVDTFRDTWDRLAKGEVWRDGRLAAIPPPNQPNPQRPNPLIPNLPNVPQPQAPAMGGPWLGIAGPNAPNAAGCRVTQVVPGSPAEKAGVKPNDIVRSVDGEEVRSIREISARVNGKKVGDELALEVRRGEEDVKLKVVLAARDNAQGDPQNDLQNRLNRLNRLGGGIGGLRGGLLPGGGLLPLPVPRIPNLPNGEMPLPDLRLPPLEGRRPVEPGVPPPGPAKNGGLGVLADPDGTRCVITQVLPGSPAEKAGLKVGDVIRKAGEHRIASFEDLLERIGKMMPGEAIDLELLRNGESIILSVTLTAR